MTKEREAEILHNLMAYYTPGQSGYEDRRDLLAEIARLRRENERHEKTKVVMWELKEHYWGKLAKAREALQKLSGHCDNLVQEPQCLAWPPQNNDHIETCVAAIARQALKETE